MQKKYLSLYEFFDIVLVSLVLFLESSCTYKNKEECFRDLHPVPPDATITGSFVNDTIVLNNSKYFHIDFNTEQSHKCLLEIYINGEKRESHFSDNGCFEIDATKLTPHGIYPLHFHIYAETKTGSIGDALGAEAFLYQKDLTLVNNYYSGNTYYPQLTFANVAGSLQCKLDVPSDGPLIRKISVSKKIGYYGLVTINLGTYYGIPPFIFMDDSYLGEMAKYYVDVYAGTDEGSFLYWYNQWSTSLYQEYKDVDVIMDQHGMPIIQWEKSKYSSNCSGYWLFNKNENSNIYELAKLNDVNQTTFHTEDISFPGTNFAYVSYVPKNPFPGYGQQTALELYTYKDSYLPGLSSFEYNQFFAPLGDDFFIGYGTNHIFRYSAQTMTKVEDISISSGSFTSISVSPNDKYLLATTGTTNFNYLLYNVATGEKTTVPASQVIGTGVSNGGASISDNGVAAVSGGNKIILYDFINNQKLAEQSFNQSASAAISPTGKNFFVSADKLYLFGFSGGIISEKWHSSGTASGYLNYSFLPDDDGQAVVIENGTLSVRNSDNWGLVRSFSVDFSSFGNIDFNSSRVFGYDSDYIRIYDFNTGVLEKKLRLGSDDYLETLKFRGNTLFYGGSYGISRKLILF
jgi:hypothetical protein